MALPTLTANGSHKCDINLFINNDSLLFLPNLKWFIAKLTGWASDSECLDVKNYKWRLNAVWHRMLY